MSLFIPDRVSIGLEVDCAASEMCIRDRLQNGHPERGQSETIRLGARALSDCDAICFMVADQPLLDVYKRQCRYCSKRRMMPSTSSFGRFQFSVEKA